MEHGINGCNTVTLTLFLVLIGPDPQEFLEELRAAFESLLGIDQWRDPKNEKDGKL